MCHDTTEYRKVGDSVGNTLPETVQTRTPPNRGRSVTPSLRWEHASGLSQASLSQLVDQGLCCVALYVRFGVLLLSGG